MRPRGRKPRLRGHHMRASNATRIRIRMWTDVRSCRKRSNWESRCRFVVWSRIDQKTCLKAIAAANLMPEVVELRRSTPGADELGTDVEAVAAAVRRLGAETIACVTTTTSCFAPRACDDVRPPCLQPPSLRLSYLCDVTQTLLSWPPITEGPISVSETMDIYFRVRSCVLLRWLLPRMRGRTHSWCHRLLQKASTIQRRQLICVLPRAACA